MSTPARHPRRWYELVFPADLHESQVLAWLHALGGLSSRGPARLFGLPTVVLEVSVQDGRLTHRLGAAPTRADFLIDQLRALAPGVRATPIEPPPAEAWTATVEFGMRRMHRTVRHDEPQAVATTLLASLSGLRRQEAARVQWIVAPAVPEAPPSQPRAPRPVRLGGLVALRPPAPEPAGVADTRRKLAEHNLLAALRVAVRTSDEQRARTVLSGIRTALGSVATPGNGFAVRPRRQQHLGQRINEARPPWLFGCQLSVSELLPLLAWPIGDPAIAGLPMGRTRQLRPSEAIARKGRIIARANFPGAERPLAITPEASRMHLQLVGPTGTGKSAVLEHLFAQDAAARAAVIMVETKGPLVVRALDLVPQHRLDDVILVDVVAEADHPVALNLLTEGSPQAVVDELTGLFEQLFPDHRGVWARELLWYGLRTLTLTPGATFVDLAVLLAPQNAGEEAWRQQIIAGLGDAELGSFWERFFSQSAAVQQRMAAPVLDRVWVLNARPEIRNIIGQSTSSFTLRQVVDGRKILLVNLAGLGETTANLLSTLLLSVVWRAVQTRQRDQPCYLFLDELGSLLDAHVDLGALFERARGFGLAICTAYQSLERLPAGMRSALLTNGRSKVIFRTPAAEAAMFAREFGPRVSESDFLHLGQHEVLCQLMTEEGLSPPVTGVTRPPLPGTGLADEARRRSRERYGRAVKEVEAEIRERRSAGPVMPKRRPKLGVEKWG